MTPIIPKRLDWPSAIGSFLLSYGVLDWHTMVFLESRLDAEQFAKAKELHFQDRVKRIQGIVDASDYALERKEGFVRFFVDLQPIRELRNHIAHGHMLLRLGEDGEPPVATLSLPKDLDATYAPESRHLNFEDLTQALGQLSQLIEEFERLTGFGKGRNDGDTGQCSSRSTN